MHFLIGGIKKTSLLDYPDKISAIVFTQGCNFNCGYCHNPRLLSSKLNEDICQPDVFLEFLKTRQGKLDGVVITGGESTLQPDIEAFITEIKSMNFLVKLDTNGYKPEIIENVEIISKQDNNENTEVPAQEQIEEQAVTDTPAVQEEKPKRTRRPNRGASKRTRSKKTTKEENAEE